MTDSAQVLTYIDKYCERTSEGLWAEPLNVISNLAFLIVFILVLKLFKNNIKNQYLKYWDISLLVVLLMCITLGSTLWHIFAQQWALYMDIIPILLFINVFIISCFYRVLQLNTLFVVLFFGVYQLFNFLVQQQYSIETLNGSIFYVPVLLTLVIIMLTTCLKKRPICHNYLIAVSLFVLALGLRTLDNSQCDNFPVGTHFLWHIIIATMLYFLATSLILNATTRRTE